MKLTLRHCEDMGDWYVIERAEHDGRHWLEPIDGGMSLQCSARFCDADVEGTSSEMLQIAQAIEERREESFKRCAVTVFPIQDGTLLVKFWSPRNSREPGQASLAEADALAAEIRTVLKKQLEKCAEAES